MIRMTDIFKVYANGTKALKGVTFELEKGEFRIKESRQE